jgi:integrase
MAGTGRRKRQKPMATIKKRKWRTAKGELKEAWQLRYFDAAGKRRSKTFDKKGDAEAYRIKSGWELSQGVHTPDSASITVCEAADLWLEAARKPSRRRENPAERSTIKSYEEIARLHIKPFLGTEKLSKLTLPAVEAYIDGLLQTRSQAMAGKAVRALSSIITEAQRRGLVAQNVAKGVNVVRSGRNKKKIIVPPKEELRAMLQTAEADYPDYYPIVLTVAFTGLRSSEMRGMRRCDVDLRAGEITVCQRADQWGEIGSPKSAAGHRTIPIPPILVTVLRQWMLRSPPSPAGLLFPNSEGGVRLHSNMLNREYWPLQIAAGLSVPTGKVDEEGRAIERARYDFHSLRHFAASAWIKQRVDLKRLTNWLGHASVQTTLDIYGHMIRDEVGDAAIVAAAQAELLA